MTESTATILARYNWKGDVRQLTRGNACLMAFELSDTAADYNRQGENHLAVGALIPAIRAIAAATGFQPPNEFDQPSNDRQYRVAWTEMIAFLDKNAESAAKFATDNAAAGEFQAAHQMNVFSKCYAEIAELMRVRTPESADDKAGDYLG